MYSQLYLPHSIVVYCASMATRVLNVVFPEGMYKSWMVQVFNIGTFTPRLEIPLGRGGVAAETVELVLQFPGCFPIQGSVYSPFTLFEDQSLKLLWGSSVVLSCSGLGPRFLAL